MWGRFASVVQRLDERERQNKRKFRETPRMKCGFCGERRSECVCCEITGCHLPCRAGSDFCERHGGRVSCEGSLMTGYVCQICNKAEDGTKFYVCCNGTFCVACHQWAHEIRDRHKPPIPDTTGSYAIQASPVVPLVPGTSHTLMAGGLPVAEVHVQETDASKWSGQFMAAANVQCDHEPCDRRALHYRCDEHLHTAPEPAQPQQTAFPDLGPPVTAYIVIGSERTPEFTPKFYGLFVVSGEAEEFVRQAYISETHGIESLGDAMVRPEHYDMGVEELQAIMAEADEFVSQAYDRYTWYGEDAERSLQIIAVEVK